MEYHHGCKLSADPMLEEALIHMDNRKSAEETVQTTRKEPELIGCEEHTVIEKSDDIQLQRAVLQLQNTMLEAHDILDKRTDQEMEMSSLCSSNEFYTTSSEDKSPSSTGEAAISTINDQMVGCLEIEANSNVEDGTHQEPICTPINKTAVTRLFEICAACNWNTPEFVLRKVDGPIHQRRFTYKVIVEVENITYTKLECFSEPRTEKIAAREHAAEGALWFLKHLGHT